MVNKATLLKNLPPFLNRVEKIKDLQSTDDIILQIIRAHERHEVEYDEIYPYFDTGDILTTCELLWDFCHENLEYKAEPDKNQTTRSPSAILVNYDSVDCKHYSLFIGGVLDAIQANEVVDWDWFYRFAGYKFKKEVYHVFPVVELADGTEIWIDPVLDYFNEKMYPSYVIDKKPMSLTHMSGIGSTGTTVQVDSRAAETQFLVLVNANWEGLKDLLNANRNIVNTDVRDYYTQNGMDFNQLLNILNMPN